MKVERTSAAQQTSSRRRRATVLSPWLPADVTFGNENGAFICSALIVNVAMLAIGRVEKLMASGH